MNLLDYRLNKLNEQQKTNIEIISKLFDDPKNPNPKTMASNIIEALKKYIDVHPNNIHYQVKQIYVFNQPLSSIHHEPEMFKNVIRALIKEELLNLGNNILLTLEIPNIEDNKIIIESILTAK